jgi:hypothetical protein
MGFRTDTKYHKERADHPVYTDAWCSSFMCWCLENSNPKYKSPHSAASGSFFAHNSVESCEAFFGAIAVFSDCNSTGTDIGTSGVPFTYASLQ